jgi:rRNA-processing protein FCF1
VSKESRRDTYVSLLSARLDSIEAKMMELLDCSTVEPRFRDSNPWVLTTGPQVRWGDADQKQQRLQTDLKRLYQDWSEQCRLLFSDAPQDLQRAMNATHFLVLDWIEKETSHDLSLDMEKNKKCFLEWIGLFREELAGLDDGVPRVILVPDVNALTNCPELPHYAGVAGGSTFEVVITSTVLGELDELKVKHRNEGFREKVEGVIRRIKGWGRQGNLLEGVTVSKTITVRTVAKEPDFTKTLGWLDPQNNDDRLIAGVLELQRLAPSAAVVLVTGDINLQNKATAAGLPWAETPTMPSASTA